MLSVMDRGMANITHELKASGLYDATLIIAFSDNGGPTSEKGPNNYPLRGSKESPWEGGTRVAAFVSGGYLPASLRGTVSHSFVHAADWCECCRCPHSCRVWLVLAEFTRRRFAADTTLSVMVGVDPTDIFHGHNVDGVDVWPMITGHNLTNPREYLPVTEQSIIWRGRWKYHLRNISMAIGTLD
jgi:hypothetical protein